MKSYKAFPHRRTRVRVAATCSSVAGFLALVLLLTGCSLSPLAKHTVAFSQAANAVINNSQDAYRAANTLHERKQVAGAIYEFDPSKKPNTELKPLLSRTQLQARMKVLDGLKAYSDSLVQITGKPSKADADALNSAASGAGANLKALSQTLASDLGSGANGSAISQTNANLVSTAVLALGQYLEAEKVRKSLPKVTQDMNPNMQALCELLSKDIDILRSQAKHDYEDMFDYQSQFVTHKGAALNPVQLRDEIGKLFSLVSEQTANDELLEKLKATLNKLALTHHALAAAAQGNNPETLSQQIAELAGAGQELANYYKTLPTK